MTQWAFDPDYRFTSPFGMRMHPVLHVNKFHRGVDLVVSPGNGPLYAFVAGKVMYAAVGKPGIGIPAEMGVVVAVRDNKGYLHLYAHLSTATVKVGQNVECGEMIGRQGTTGSSTGNHLHYEIRKVASPSFGWTATEAGVVEPTKYLTDYYRVTEPVKAPPVVEVKPKMNKEDANKIIPFLSAAYMATEDKEARAEFNRLANELRIASGQPKQ